MPNKTLSAAPPVRKKSYKMPAVEKFLRMKKMYNPRKKPVWVYLDEEMKENQKKNIKPYNMKVGIWLRFLKELHFYNQCLQKRVMRQINKECGPIWYMEFSSYQREILDHLPSNFYRDIIDERPKRVKVDLWNLGVTLKIPSNILMESMLDCEHDTGVFFWTLYTAIYGMPPSILRKSYDNNAKVLMSALVFIDMKECIETFNKLTYTEPDVNPPKRRKTIQKKSLDAPFALYLERLEVPKLCNVYKKYKKHPPPKIQYKFKLRSQNSYENLRMDTDFLQERRNRHIKKKEAKRECNYKFFEPPIAMKNLSPEKRAELLLKRLMNRPAVMTSKPPTEINKYTVGGVALADYKNRYLIEGVTSIPNNYVHIEEGRALVKEPLETLFKPVVKGYAKYTRSTPVRKCECLKYEQQVMDYLNNSKCQCGHRYDFGHKKPHNSARLKYIQPPNEYGPMMVDRALIYQIDPVEETIKNAVEDAMASDSTHPQSRGPSLLVEDLKPKVVIAILLADTAKSPLIIPHLPLANTLNSLLAWVRRKVHGRLTTEEDKALMLRSQRRWMQLAKMDFRARAYHIPFTQKHLDNMTWKERNKLQRLFTTLLEDFRTRNRLMQLEQSRLWWSTMEYDEYPGKGFLDVFHTLVPGRMADTYLNPHFMAVQKRIKGTKYTPPPFT